MPPRLRHLRKYLRWRRDLCARSPLQQQQTLSLTTASISSITPAPLPHQILHSTTPVARYPPTQPPSHKPPEFRKSQLHRQYASLLRSSPLMLLFHHNNLRSGEWLGVRRELTQALRKVDEAEHKKRQETGAEQASATGDSSSIKLQIVQTGMFASALRIVEFYHPELQPQSTVAHQVDPTSPTSAAVPDTLSTPSDPRHTHGLSRAAWEAVRDRKLKHGLEPLLSGPVAILAFPTVSPPHLAAALSILAPTPAFPAPRRRANPGYHEPAVQSGVQKLLLIGARVERSVFDPDKTRWVGSIEGGLDGLRGQLVALLQGVGQRLTQTLEGAGRSLYYTLEGRKRALEEEEKGGDTKGEAAKVDP